MVKEYEVGYGRPPVANRWERGRSGNPAGRPKKIRPGSLVAKLENELSQMITIKENGRSFKVTKAEAYFKRLVTDAINGNAKAVNQLARLLPLLEKYEETNPMLHPPVIIIDNIPRS